jgi:beta-phosphoglucomutase-like phosphatase (HAD superfamily)
MECVVFEDAFSGLDAGMAAGIFTFGMATSNAADAIRSRCSYVLDGFEDLDYAKICHIIGAQ